MCASISGWTLGHAFKTSCADIETRIGGKENSDDHAAPKSITSAVESLREGMQRHAKVSLSDCSSSAGGLEGKRGERFSNLERMGSRKNILSEVCWVDDSRGEDIKKSMFDNAPAEAAGVGHYKRIVPQPDERWGAEIYEKRQRVWREHQTANTTVADFKFRGCDVSRCSETDQEEEEEKSFKASNRNYNPGGAEDDKIPSSSRREHMFDKAVTPSDVGKLNRLVIPKQHAEKYLPLDTDANEKGLLLSFEDSTGKSWRFRYSYWNSSQSYVLTKGWSRFVKEKKLDAGDIVSFHRATHQDSNLQRLFISCRRKPCSAAQPPELPGSAKCPFRFSSPFQFAPDAVNNIGASHGRQIISPRALNQQWMPLLWSASNIAGESSRGAAETWALQANAQHAQHNDLLNSLRFITTDKKPRQPIHDSGLSVRSSNSSDCGRPAMGTEISVRAPALHAIQFKSRGISRNDLSRPLENKVPEAAATSFDHCTSKKVVRLFGVDLECGKVDVNY